MRVSLGRGILRIWDIESSERSRLANLEIAILRQVISVYRSPKIAQVCCERDTNKDGDCDIHPSGRLIEVVLTMRQDNEKHARAVLKSFCIDPERPD